MLPSVEDWLLAPDNPSVRYRTLTELRDRPQDDPAVRQAWAAIPASQPVARIFSKMHPDGYWLSRGKGAGVDYAHPSSTHFVLAYLAELGLDRDDARVARCVERYLSLQPPARPVLAPWEIPPDYRNHQSCLYAYNLRTFVMLGYRDDPRIQARVNVLLDDGRYDGGYLCERPSFRPHTKSCIRGSQKALMAYAALPELWTTPACQRLVDYFLRRRVFYRIDRPAEVVRGELLRVSFPFVIHGSLLESLYALARMGYGQHPALEPAWAQLLARCGPDGRYVLDWHPNVPFDPGPPGQPNKWTTLYACLALKYRELP